MNTLPNSETPRTNVLDNAIKEMELSTIYALHQSPCKCSRCVVVSAAKQVHQLEKELNEAKAAIQLMETGKYGRADLSEQIRELTSRLKVSERANSEMREVLKKYFTHLGQEIRLKSLNESFKDGTQSLSREVAEILDSSTSGQSYIPCEVGEKMYEALGFAKVAFNQAKISLPFTEHKMDEAIQLAQSYGLGKDKTE